MPNQLENIIETVVFNINCEDHQVRDIIEIIKEQERLSEYPANLVFWTKAFYLILNKLEGKGYNKEFTNAVIKLVESRKDDWCKGEEFLKVDGFPDEELQFFCDTDDECIGLSVWTKGEFNFHIMDGSAI